ncbi:hypothetical protein GA0115259_100818 [Streptomyces sp. MnatMP-M17]|nr:hypothetical protein GA0115259_100818 [Streptomyces sp. MnatMP-M17]
MTSGQYYSVTTGQGHSVTTSGMRLHLPASPAAG